MLLVLLKQILNIQHIANPGGGGTSISQAYCTILQKIHEIHLEFFST